jgi:hypothetical protein
VWQKKASKPGGMQEFSKSFYQLDEAIKKGERQLFMMSMSFHVYVMGLHTFLHNGTL